MSSWRLVRRFGDTRPAVAALPSARMSPEQVGAAWWISLLGARCGLGWRLGDTRPSARGCPRRGLSLQVR